jgi:hypothetical protein
MREVHVPTRCLARSLNLQVHQGAWDRFREWTQADARPGIEVEMDRLVERLREAQAHEYARADELGWAVLWAGTALRETPDGGVVADVRIVCVDETEGERLVACVLGCLEQTDVVTSDASRLTEIPEGTAPVYARMGPWSFGRQPDALDADLVGKPGVSRVEIIRHWDHPPLTCPICGAVSRPRSRINGYPSRSGLLAVELEEAAYGTCCHDGPLAPAECGECGTGMVPGTVSGSEAVAVVQGYQAQPRPETGFRRVWTPDQGGPAIWTPRATQRGGKWIFRLPRRVRKHLRARPGSWVVLRPAGSSCLLLPWESLARILAGNSAKRNLVVIDPSHPTVVRIAGIEVETFVDPEELPRSA